MIEYCCARVGSVAYVFQGANLLPTRDIRRSVRPLGGGYFEVDVRTPEREYRSLRPRLAACLEVANQVVLLFKQLTHASIPLRLFLPLSLLRERIEGEGPYLARSFARDSRFSSCPESFRLGLCKILLKSGCGKRAYNGLTKHARQAHLQSSYTPPVF